MGRDYSVYYSFVLAGNVSGLIFSLLLECIINSSLPNSNLPTLSDLFFFFRPEPPFLRQLVESESKSVSHSVLSDSWRSHGLQPARLLCPRDSPGKNPGVGCHFLFQGVFPTQGLNLDPPALSQY